MKQQSNISVNFKKLSKKAVVPTYAYPTSAGMDLVATSKTATDRYVEFGLGFATAIPEGWAGFIYPNSRISKYDLILANSVPIIDAEYRGEWKLRFKRSLWSTFKITLAKMTNFFGLKDIDVGYDYECKEFNIGDVVGQLVLHPIYKVEFKEVEELDETARGDGGFGSTASEKAEVVAEAPVKEKKKSKKSKK